MTSSLKLNLTLVLLACMFATVLALNGAREAKGVALVVNTLGDAPDATAGTGVCEATATVGDCTLRAALQTVNTASAGPHTITFAIPGAAPFVITLGSALPDVSVTSVTIDGLSQTGAGCQAPKIVIDGGDAATGFNLTGGSAVVKGFVIRDVTTGIRVASASNVVQCNFIGTTETGLAASGAGEEVDDGIIIVSAAGNTIGGAAAFTVVGNVISGVTDDGVNISGGPSTGTSVLSNRIGTNVTGDAGIPNGGDGVEITGAASSNTVGGVVSGVPYGNLISANGASGVNVNTAATSNNIVRSNVIGIEGDLTTPLANVDGVRVSAGATGTLIGGSAPGEGNTIGGNSDDGVVVIDVATTGTIIAGNFIGTNAFGADVGNAGDGVYVVLAPSTTIGCTAISPCNVISGNGDDGVDIVGPSGALASVNVLGNYIGLNPAGAIAVANGGNGIEVNTANGITIGGTLTGSRNVISGNGSNGIKLTTSNSTIIDGNYVGTNFNGTNAVANGGDGINVDPSDSTAIRNSTISGNSGSGILIVGGTGTIVQSNMIGTNPSGTSAIGNGGSGVWVSISSANTIGGAGALRNVISGNGADGVFIAGDASDSNIVRGNHVGVGADGLTAIGNLGNGIEIVDGDLNQIGGTGAGEGNVIRYNAMNGVFVPGAATDNNRISRNSIDNNGPAWLGIDLNLFTPPLPNPAAGAEGNNAQVAPIVSGAIVSGGVLLVDASLDGAATLTSLTIEFFTSPMCHATGFGEGRTYVGTLSILTDGLGDGSTNITSLGVPATPGHVLTATATHPNGDTSEFSNCLTIGGVAASAPVITNIVPPNGPLNVITPVTINGANFQGGAVVLIDGVTQVIPTSVSATVITYNMPASTIVTTAQVTVRNPDLQVSNAATFTYQVVSSAPVCSVMSQNLIAGQLATITGANFVLGVQVQFDGGAFVTANWVNATQISITVPSGAGTVLVTVRNPDTQVCTILFTYLGGGGGFNITSLSPAAGLPGTPVNVFGNGFINGNSIVYFGASLPVFTSFVSANQLSVTVPGGCFGIVQLFVRNTGPIDTNALSFDCAGGGGGSSFTTLAGIKSYAWNGQTVPISTLVSGGQLPASVTAIFTWIEQSGGGLWQQWFAASPTLTTLFNLEPGKIYFFVASGVVTVTVPNVVTLTNPGSFQTLNGIVDQVWYGNFESNLPAKFPNTTLVAIFRWSNDSQQKWFVWFRNGSFNDLSSINNLDHLFFSATGALTIPMP